MAINETVNVTTPSRLNDNGFYVSSGYLQFPDDQDLENITCTVKHENQEKNNTIQVDKRVPETVDKPNCEIQKSSNQNASDILETNFMSLTVMGLRILFFKSVAFNVLMTARAWVF